MADMPEQSPVLDVVRAVADVINKTAARTDDPSTTSTTLTDRAVQKLERLQECLERLHHPDIDAAPVNIANELRPYARELQRRARERIVRAEAREKEARVALRVAAAAAPQPSAAADRQRPPELDELDARSYEVLRRTWKIADDLTAQLPRAKVALASAGVWQARRQVTHLKRVLRLVDLARLTSWLVVGVALAGVVVSEAKEWWSPSQLTSLMIVLIVFLAERVLTELVKRWRRDYLRARLPSWLYALWADDATITAQELLDKSSRLSAKPSENIRKM